MEYTVILSVPFSLLRESQILVMLLLLSISAKGQLTNSSRLERLINGLLVMPNEIVR